MLLYTTLITSNYSTLHKLHNNSNNNNNYYYYHHHHSYNYNYNYITQCYTTLSTLLYTATATTTATQLHYTNSTTLQLHLATYNYDSATLHYNYNCNYNYNYNCATPHYATLHPAVVARWPLQTLQPLQKTQPPFGPQGDSLCHPCIITTHLSYSFLSLKLRPPPCAVLLVNHIIDMTSSDVVSYHIMYISSNQIILYHITSDRII